MPRITYTIDIPDEGSYDQIRFRVDEAIEDTISEFVENFELDKNRIVYSWDYDE